MLFKMSRLAFYCSAGLLCLLNGNVFAGQTTQIDVTPNGDTSSSGFALNSFDRYSDISANGRYVAFESHSDNLVAGEKFNPILSFNPGVFIRDLLTHKTERVSFTANEMQESGNYARVPSINADGRYVVFTSEKFNVQSIFVRDRLTHQLEQVSVASNGERGNDGANEPSLSAEGRYVVFSSRASNLVKGDTNHTNDVFVHDRLTRKTERVSVASNGAQGNGNSFYTSISADGRYVAYTSNASNLVGGDINQLMDVFIHDRFTHKTERVSKQGGTSSSSSLSANGRYVAFSTDGTDEGIKVHDRITHKTEKITRDSIIADKDLYLYPPSLSADGRFLSFQSYHTKTADRNAFIHDRLTHKTDLVNVGLGGNATGYGTKISADGRYIAFDYMVNDQNIFVRDRLLDNHHHADLKITPTTKPTTLKLNTQGAYLYTITNNGKDVVPDVSLIHLVSGGSAVSFKPSQGKCSASSAETVCHLGKLSAGKKLTLRVTVKAQSMAFSQQVTVSGAPMDAVPTNNQVSVTTPIVLRD